MDQKIENNAKHGRQYINDAHGLKLSTGEAPKVEEAHHGGEH
jgi:hypothetical protein